MVVVVVVVVVVVFFVVVSASVVVVVVASGVRGDSEEVEVHCVVAGGRATGDELGTTGTVVGSGKAVLLALGVAMVVAHSVVEGGRTASVVGADDDDGDADDEVGSINAATLLE